MNKVITEGTLSISYVADATCGKFAGKQFTGGVPGKYYDPAAKCPVPAVRFNERVGKANILIKYESRPELAALVEEYAAIQAERRAAAEAEERRRAKMLSVYLSSRGWGDYPAVYVQIDPAADPETWIADAHKALASEHDVDNPDQTDEEILAECQKEIDKLTNKEAAEKAKKAEEAAKYEEARRTGKPVAIRTWMSDCHDKKEDCSFDSNTMWAMPDGTSKTTWTHCY